MIFTCAAFCCCYLFTKNSGRDRNISGKGFFVKLGSGYINRCFHVPISIVCMFEEKHEKMLVIMSLSHVLLLSWCTALIQWS